MNLNPFIIELLRKRGITTEEDICEFLSDKPQKTYDPFLLADMEAGVDLILSETKRMPEYAYTETMMPME